ASGGSAGMLGIEHVQISGTSSWKKLKPGQAIDVAPGDRIRVQTPGGGGWGPAEKH
ncbi:MAG: hydantoinase B/oxoprolinase family protein, partial [Planctomycetes bacterium]|nr:hydantoinase B/oxoprolinase family protein [Planctomycetota bacterium]